MMLLFALLPWLCLMIAGLVASVALLVWGHKSGQFADQDRARYLPLWGENIVQSRTGQRHGKREVYVLAGFMVMTGVFLAICLFMAAV
ncbi:MAG: hypothetical protein ACYDHW_15375 [Syntrophorhabdaceae bacterium]